MYWTYNYKNLEIIGKTIKLNLKYIYIDIIFYYKIYFN